MTTILTGLMKSERLAVEREAKAEERKLEAQNRLDPEWPYSTLPFPDDFGIMIINDNEKEEGK